MVQLIGIVEEFLLQGKQDGEIDKSFAISQWYGSQIVHDFQNSRYFSICFESILKSKHYNCEMKYNTWYFDHEIWECQRILTIRNFLMKLNKGIIP